MGRAVRRPRSDRGTSRLGGRVEAELARLLNTQERPSASTVSKELHTFCRRKGLKAPARATVYNAIERVDPPLYAVDALPKEVRDALYNLQARDSSNVEGLRVRGDHIVFYAFNHGTPRALSFAAGLPWLCLWRALRRPGWRPKSRSLLAAVASHRGI
jgi:hypothetical protein